MTGFSLSGGRFVVTGAAGFLGSHLARRLLDEGASVVGIDNLLTGRLVNLDRLVGDADFTFIDYDVTNYLHVSGSVDGVLHFASPASPVDYLELPIQTMKVGSLGTHKALGLALAKDARFLMASTSEIYGDPQVHPQPESYWGHVNPVGPRGVYDEAKRFSEALVYAYRTAHGLAVRVPRIFNTYGPWMRRADGRAVPTFIAQALADKPVTVHGDGSQTRSLCYVDDMIDGFVALFTSDWDEPCNLGNPEEVTVRHLAELVIELTGSRSEIIESPRPTDDPQVRQPDITTATRELGWSPQVTLRDGLQRTIDWFRATA
ncbi:MAG: UDP-glucuronic acid decarboxylase family protein [Nitriliruptorales bacterium]|nr:UDP-glucuronic acid decarboxylase family protein [Nitriliruptorales bacterium]